ncbi:MAG: sigma-54 dependent transcriptional regulator [Gemmataceae bacterium]|nr:sigma-54 dependent transcriptional regulator [Gemmataceae bacterium]MCI0737721.1 sigma-54 dependent transcriptional regulator [Gemmataceae bacterium]
MSTLLAIDDDPLILDCLRFAFPGDKVTLHTAKSAQQGLDLFAQHRPDAVLLDVRLPDMSGLDAYRSLRQVDPKVPVLFITGYGTSETAIEAMRLGAFDYLVKPLDPDHLNDLVQKAFEISRLMRVPAVLEEEEQAGGGELLVGHSSAMQGIYKSIGRVAPQDVTVLILGESGTGKEMVARAIYHYSKRAAGPFLAINCAAIPETLLESELFGHEKGSFTGADRKRIGKFEQCDGGTLFLDEIGDMTPLTQTKILRVLQDQAFERVGGNDTIRTNVRVIAATNRDLEKRMAEGAFRSDLFYRLNVYTIKLPPLRERLDDLPLLVEHFLKRYCQELGKEPMRVAEQTIDQMRAYAWPGNIRELQSVLKQAILQATGPVLIPDFLPPSLEDEDSAPAPAGFPDVVAFVQQRLKEQPDNLYGELIAALEKVLFAEVLRHTRDNQSQAARLLGITRQTLRSRLLALGLEKKADGDDPV